ncbi:MAG TPA: hypothetical protein VFD82_02945 [Planctomycetota bacterium]|nr:hypothetical protein [Planctomycetota bacterium]
MNPSFVSGGVRAAIGAAVLLSCPQTLKQALAAAQVVGHDGNGRLARLSAASVPNLGQWRHAAR